MDEAYKALNNYEQFKNEELQRRVLNVAFEIGGNILNRIWTPNQDMKNLVSHYVERHFTNNFVIIVLFRSWRIGQEHHSQTNEDSPR